MGKPVPAQVQTHKPFSARIGFNKVVEPIDERPQRGLASDLVENGLHGVIFWAGPSPGRNVKSNDGSGNRF